MSEFVSKRAGRLDQVITEELTGFSRAQVRGLLQAGQVRVNGKKVRTGVQVQPGDRITVQDAQVPGLVPVAEPNVPLTLVHEDDALLLVNKAASLPTAPLRPDGLGTLANGLVARYSELRGVGHSALEPGLLWRLDNETSGLVLVARQAEVFAALVNEQEHDRVVKTYWALVRGELATDAGDIELPIAHDARDRARMVAVESTREAGRLGARPARTRYHVARRFRGATLVACEITRGARHQIRVHLASLGTPIQGDALYDAGWHDRVAPRHFLHAREVRFMHPTRREIVQYSAALPDELEQWLAGLSQI